MGLIKIGEFSGSEIGKAVMEALEMVGVVNKLNINGYSLSVEGIQSPTPKGMIDDTPSKHKITVERNQFIVQANKKEYKKLLENTDQYNNLLNTVKEKDLQFISKEDTIETSEITRDKNDYVWYKHKIELEINQLVLETTENYMKRIFETVATYIVDSIESMLKKED